MSLQERPKRRERESTDADPRFLFARPTTVKRGVLTLARKKKEKKEEGRKLRLKPLAPNDITY